jgi:hypothetical protein
MTLTTTRGGAATFVGRTLAACVHPYAAWRVLPRSARVVLISTYVTLSYLAVLSVLLILR